MKKLFSGIFSVVLICLSCFSMTVSAAEKPVIPRHDFNYTGSSVEESLDTQNSFKTSNAYFRDEADIFNETYERDLTELIQNTADRMKMNLGIFIGGNYRSDSQTKTFTTEAAKTLFGNKADTNSVFIYLDFEEENTAFDFIRTMHDAQLYYPASGKNNRIDLILDDMYRYLPSSEEEIYSKDVYQAIKAACSDLVSYANSGPVADASYRNNEANEFRSVVFGRIVTSRVIPLSLPALGGGALFVFMIIMSIISSISRVFKRRSSTYYSNNYNDYNEYNSDGSYMGYGAGYGSSRHYHERRRRPPRHHSSGHRSSGGHSSGSHHSSGSSGGGGRHR